jgi:hydroxymethylpyrimidine pyrophosphatase-like HAD family hydrolase
MMRDYAVKLSSIRSVEHYNKELVELEQELSQYETNRDKTIKPEYEQGKFKRVNVNSEAELEKDARDREDEKKENELVASETPSSAKVPLKVSLKQKEEEEEEEEEEEKDQIEGTVSSEKLDISEEKLASALASIKDKIGLYLEELLGVGDEELTEYITMIIQDTKSKSALTEELKETFDEDADKISEAIWKDLLEAITV